MKILVTGGSGFIGTHLVNRLIEEGHDVTVLDSKPPQNRKVHYINGDIRSSEDVRRAMGGCKACFHLAAISQVRNEDKDLLYKVNYLGSKTVFNEAEKAGAKIIFASSAAVYGKAPVPHKETSKCSPISYYATTKLKAEQLLKGTDAFIARFFNVYGPGAGTAAVNIFCQKMMNYEEIQITGTGRQTRDFVYVSDVVDALLLGLEHGGLYNIGTGKETSIIGLVEIIERMSRYKPNIKKVPAVPIDIERSVADITKISKLGWKPKTDLKAGIKLVLESYGEKFTHM